MRPYFSIAIAALACLGVGFLSACVPAMAVDTAIDVTASPPLVYGVDFTTIALGLFGTVAAGIAIIFRSLVAATVTWIEAQTKITVSNDQRALIDTVLSRAIDFGIAQVEATLKNLGTNGQLTVDAHSEAIQHAADYALTHIPEALAYFGLDRASVVRMVTSRMAGIPLGASAPVGQG